MAILTNWQGQQVAIDPLLDAARHRNSDTFISRFEGIASFNEEAGNVLMQAALLGAISQGGSTLIFSTVNERTQISQREYTHILSLALAINKKEDRTTVITDLLRRNPISYADRLGSIWDSLKYGNWETASLLLKPHTSNDASLIRTIKFSAIALGITGSAFLARNFFR